MTPKEGKREQKERGLSRSTNSLSTSTDMHVALNTCTTHRNAKATNTQPPSNAATIEREHRGQSRAECSASAPVSWPVAIPRSSFPGPSAHLRLAEGGTKPLQYRAAANPPALAPSFACRRLISRFRTAHSRALLSHSVPDEPGLLPPPLASPCQLRGPPLAASAAASPFFPRWALGGVRELGPPPGSCFRQSLVGWDGDGCCGKEEEAEAGTDGHLSTLRSAALQDCVL